MTCHESRTSVDSAECRLAFICFRRSVYIKTFRRLFYIELRNFHQCQKHQRTARQTGSRLCRVVKSTLVDHCRLLSVSELRSDLFRSSAKISIFRKRCNLQRFHLGFRRSFYIKFLRRVLYINFKRPHLVNRSDNHVSIFVIWAFWWRWFDMS